MRAVLSFAALAACGPEDRVVVHAALDHAEAWESYVALTDHAELELELTDAPRARGRGAHVVVRIGELADCAGCYRLVRPRPDEVEVLAGDLLGAQYGVTALLEAMGFRFFHPQHTLAPEHLAIPDDPALYDRLVAPEVARRGLHMHTLHPIEGMQDFWMPSEAGAERARRVIDWAVRSRANHLQWVALDDIESGDPSAWQAHTKALVDHAHARGLTTGLGIQLFGTSNLQLAWDLVDEPSDPATEDAEMRHRLAGIAPAGFDVLNLSFGEFFGEDPETFIDASNRAYDAMQEVAGPVEVPAVIHVGNYDDLRVTWNDQEMLYYFLAAYTDRPLVPWIHTVMYYDLFEDAGGAYLHDAFDEHREFLLDALQAGDPVGYFPETAYWVAFDINVPTYLPVYVRSRWTDLDRIRAAGPQVQDHVIFSSGWEWGYWQNDYATLRASYTLPDAPEQLFDEMFAPLGDDGAALAGIVSDLVELQHLGLIEQRLAAYMAGRQAVIDIGDNVGIVSQPDRPRFGEVAAFDAAAQADFAQTLADLDAMAAGTEALVARLDGLTTDDPVIDEVRDGVEVDALRARFATQVFGAALALAQGTDPAPFLAQADARIADAAVVIARRHGAMWDPEPERLTSSDLPNPTIYDFGYLARAEELCFWHRERIEVGNLVTGATDPVPPCP